MNLGTLSPEGGGLLLEEKQRNWEGEECLGEERNLRFPLNGIRVLKFRGEAVGRRRR